GSAFGFAGEEPAAVREVPPQRRPPAPVRSSEQRRRRSNSATAPTNNPTRQAYVTSLAALTVTGFVALVQEVAWTRVLALTIGPTTYAFSAMLTLFLLGLAVGSALGSRVFVRSRQPFLTLAAVMVVAGGAALAATPAVSRLPL